MRFSTSLPCLNRFISNTRYLEHPENQYLQLIRTILSSGTKQKTRNANTYSLNGTMMRFPLRNRTFPLLTTKKMPSKTILNELIWFIRGQTSNQWLTERRVHIWDKNTQVKEVQERNDKEGWPSYDLGPVYGHQWRYFNAPYIGCNQDYDGKGVDQLQGILDGLMHEDEAVRHSRRWLMSAWNPCQIPMMALPPCHVLSHFILREDKYLDCIVYQRSGDVGLGVPFNIASYSALTHLIAHHTGHTAGDFIYMLGNAHIYEDHAEVLEKQTHLEPYPFPELRFESSYSDINTYDIQDMKLKFYVHHPKLEMKMAA